MVRSLAKIVLVVTILLMAVPATQAADGQVEDRSGWSVSRALSWSFFSDLWDVFSEAWANNGCWADPSGTCQDSVQRENGCILDPNGGCHD